MRLSGQRGATLIEVLTVVAIVALALMVTAVVALPQISREEMRGTAYEIYAYMQLARVEAVTRNVECRFVLNLKQRRMGIVDTKGTVTTSDDEIVHQATLDPSVSFARPDSGSVVTLEAVADGIFRTRFAQDGTVTAGTGDVHLFGGDQFRRISVLGAGGSEVARWNGSAWALGG